MLDEYNRLIFISHKFSDDPDTNRKNVDKICKYWYKKGYIPISPLHLFSYMNYENLDDRDLIMKVCYYLILLCPTIAVYHQSEGCRLEEAFAELSGKTIFRMYEELDEVD